MATNNKKTSSQRKGGTAKKSSSGKKTGGKKNQKQSQGPDLLTIAVVLIAIVLVIVLISKHSKENKEETGNQPTGTAAVTATSTPEDPTKEPEDQVVTPKPTEAVTTKAPDATPTVPPTPTPVPTLSETEAKRIAEHIVQMDKYTIELLDDHLMIDGAEYYEFCINDEKGEAMLPLLIVEKTKGTLWCYDFSGVVAPIEKFPVDNTETGNEGAATMSEEDAKKKLLEYSGAALGLAKEPSAYEMTMDEWTTVADGKECYGVNLFETTEGKKRLRGIFYVALDGSAVYSKDDVTGEFIER